MTQIRRREYIAQRICKDCQGSAPDEPVVEETGAMKCNNMPPAARAPGHAQGRTNQQMLASTPGQPQVPRELFDGSLSP